MYSTDRIDSEHLNVDEKINHVFHILVSLCFRSFINIQILSILKYVQNVTAVEMLKTEKNYVVGTTVLMNTNELKKKHAKGQQYREVTKSIIANLTVFFLLGFHRIFSFYKRDQYIYLVTLQLKKTLFC